MEKNTHPSVKHLGSSSPDSNVDFIIITALEEELDSVLNLLPESQQLPPTSEDIRTYYQTDLPVTFSDKTKASYRIIVMGLLGMGRVQSAIAASDAIHYWHPQNIILVGIAGGMSAQDIQIGDILISDQVIDYELQKLKPQKAEVRWEVQRADARLLNASKNFKDGNWQKLVKSERPEPGHINIRVGTIASGDKVIAFKDILDSYKELWPKLIGVEMEAAGVSSAAFQSSEKPGFFMIRGVSDLADEQKDSDDVGKWRSYACDVAASFAIAFLKSGPIPLSEKTLQSTTKQVQSLMNKSDTDIGTKPVEVDDNKLEQLPEIQELLETIRIVPELPSINLITYARLWQFKTWLRHMVYVELRAKYGKDWENHLAGNVNHAKKSDQKSTHIPSPEKMNLSFVSFDALINTISDDWALFESYLPRKTIWDAKIEEVSQIRDRIAHFRLGYIDDPKRVIQLLRDVDKGFHKFCTSLNQSIHSLSVDVSDPVIYKFAAMNPYVKRQYLNANNSIYSHYSTKFEIKFEIVKRPWSDTPKDFSQVIGQPGYFYDLNIHCYDNRIFKYDELLKRTASLHNSVLYLMLDGFRDNLRIILPSVLGKDNLITLFDAFIDASANNIWPGAANHSFSDTEIENNKKAVQSIADKWPEYVLGPENPLTFLEPEMICSFFNA